MLSRYTPSSVPCSAAAPAAQNRAADHNRRNRRERVVGAGVRLTRSELGSQIDARETRANDENV